MPGYPRVVGAYHPGVGAPGAGRQSMVRGYVAGEGVEGEEVIGYTHDGEPIVGRHPHGRQHQTHGLPAHLQPQSPPWRAMIAPGSPPVGEGHVPIPLNPETFGGVWGAGATPAGAPAGATIIFSARPQKQYKTSRLLIRGTKSGVTAVGNLVGQ